MVCKDLEPKLVFQFFEEICKIPHGSGNTRQISDYCVRFARERNLTCYQDEQNNVIILKPGTPGYENSEPVIIQGHMDMVCERESDTDIDFETDGLKLYVDGDFLRARGTTLGGDDGIALAYAFALLDSRDISHPPLEVVFTVDEEVGMLGAESIDLSMLKGKRLLNIDSDEEGIFLTSCAGGLRADCELPVAYEKAEGQKVLLKVEGLLGGHSGAEIHKERANAIIVAGRILTALKNEVDISIVSILGGQMDNAIPREAAAALVISPKDADELKQSIEKWNAILKKEYRSADPNICLSLEPGEAGSYQVLDRRSMIKVLLFLRSIPYGVQNRSLDIPGLVETSLNPGILKLEKECLKLCFAIRSSVTSRKYDVTEKLCFLTEFLGGQVSVYGDYPAWEYKADSHLRELMRSCYLELFQEEPQIKAIHAGLECGILSGKINGLDCISFGPNNFDIHTPQERLSISSTERVWKLILEFLRRAK